jgi:hypothetical protein
VKRCNRHAFGKRSSDSSKGTELTLFLRDMRITGLAPTPSGLAACWRFVGSWF